MQIQDYGYPFTKYLQFSERLLIDIIKWKSEKIINKKPDSDNKTQYVNYHFVKMFLECFLLTKL